MTGLLVLLLYVAAFVLSFLAVRAVALRTMAPADFRSLKTVTFGDESAVRANRIASVVSLLVVFFLWAAFTNGNLPVPKMPGPFAGQTSFTYTLSLPDGRSDDAEVTLIVFPEDQIEIREDGQARRLTVDDPEVDPGPGFAKNDGYALPRYGTEVANVFRNDEVSRSDGAFVSAINGIPVEPASEDGSTDATVVTIPGGTVRLTPKGTPLFQPDTGLRMPRLYLPAPDVTWTRFMQLNREGYRGFTLIEHTWASLYRVILGFFFGALIGIPLGYAMGLTDWARGWFDPIVEFMRPVPPLALIPLMIIWFGIGDVSKVILLFLAALWIMAIAARSGVSGVRITKVHAAYSLGASKWQILSRVIIPNSLPEIFTGARVAMGVCWGTVVAAELVAAEKGLGMMIMVASKFQLTDIVIVGIILIGIIGFLIDVGIRAIERALVPWKGKG
ncbi:MAG: ABC transporter permease [Shimia sp.]